MCGDQKNGPENNLVCMAVASEAQFVVKKRMLRNSLVSSLAPPLGSLFTRQTHVPQLIPTLVTRAMSDESSARSFGPWPVHPSEVFATSQLSFAFVNLKPIVPGHVLVSPKAVVSRFTELSSAQVADLWILAQRVGSMLEAHHKVESLTLSIQDGPDAGQSVPHVHIHVLPRVKGDFEPNDKVYDALDEGDVKRNLDEERVARTAEEMAAEAAMYRPYFD